MDKSIEQLFAENLLGVNQLGSITAMIDLLPRLVDSLCQCDQIIQDHEKAIKAKNIESDFLLDILLLYKQGKISSSQAMAMVSALFPNKTIAVDKVISNALKVLE